MTPESGIGFLCKLMVRHIAWQMRLACGGADRCRDSARAHWLAAGWKWADRAVPSPRFQFRLRSVPLYAPVSATQTRQDVQLPGPDP